VEIQGQGEFVVATNQLVGTIIFRNPDRTREDLKIPPRQSVVIDETWLKVPHFVRRVAQGDVSLSRSDTVPEVTEMKVAEQYEGLLTSNLKHLVVVIASCQLDANGELPPQYLSAIHIGDLLTDARVPRSREVSVTPEYLTTTHLHFLKALQDLETRYQNRRAVLKEVERALKHIREME
jgi:hypothetical protein